MTLVPEQSQLAGLVNLGSSPGEATIMWPWVNQVSKSLHLSDLVFFIYSVKNLENVMPKYSI